MAAPPAKIRTDIRVDIRAAGPADFEAAARCVGVVARERAYIGFLDPPPLDDSRTFWSGLIEKGCPFLVADAGGTVVGWCDVTPGARQMFAHVGTLGMGLLPDHRGRGVGGRLLAAAIAASRSCGFEKVELAVFADNVRARRVYERAGFVIEGTRLRRARIDGIYKDEVMMGLQLKS